MKFYSDNTATVSPEILAAIAAANCGMARGYGDDEWTRRLDAVFGEFFGHEVRVFTVATGTAANALALATLLPPWGAVFAHAEAHIVRDECGAVELASGGARIVLVGGAGAKIDAATLTRAIDANPPSVHTLQPAAVSVSQATELGTVYRPAELRALGEIAHARGLHLHMDGARFANALVYLDCEPADLTWRAGVDVLSFGATKNGALGAEAVVFFDPALVREFELRRKRAGQLLSKSRFVAAQLLALLETGLWRRNAERSNRLAQAIGAACGGALLHPVEANEVFARLGAGGKARLRAAGFEFYDWGAGASGEARFVTSWDQPEGDVAALCDALRLLEPGSG